LNGSVVQADARVQRQVIEDLAGFYRDASRQAARATIERENNPLIVAEAAAGLGKYRQSEDQDLLISLLNRASHQNVVAGGAIRAMRAGDDPIYIKPLREALETHLDRFTAQGFAEGLDALAYLARDLDDRAPVREFLLGLVNHPRRPIQIGAIGALGTLRDPAAIEALQTFVGDDESDPVVQTAQTSLRTLRDYKKIPVELSDLRQEVEDLKQASKKSTQDLETLRKQIEASDNTGQDEPVKKRRGWFGWLK
jgi:HEAT repeat protein